MQKIYLDHAATSFPKAPGVPEAMVRYLTDVGGNPGRGSYQTAMSAESTMLTLREQLCTLFDSPDPECCIFTPGATFGLNLVLKGTLHPGDHVLVSSVEHNAVMRPLNQIAGITIEKVPCAPDGSLLAADVAARFRPETRLVCLTHASNVCGTLLPVAEVGALCREREIAFVIDASQTAGHVPVRRVAFGADAIVMPGHKGLLGPQGIGAVLLSPSFAAQLRPLVSGGTGSRSNMETQPEELPDKFEAGTQNLPGIYGLHAAVAYIMEHQQAIQQENMRLCGLFLEGAARLPGVRILGKPGVEGRVSVVSLDFPKLDNAMVADRLAREYGISTRCGLHCAPSAHRTLGSFPQGSVRFTIGHGNTQAEIAQTLEALSTIVTQRKTFADL